MNHRPKYFFIFYILLFVYSCKPKPDSPVVLTLGAKNIDAGTVTFFGAITGRNITAKGFYFDTISPPSNSNFTNEGSNSKSFQSTISNLKPGKLYYYQAYATNEMGEKLGDLKSITTFDKDKVFTFSATINNYSSAILGSSFSTAVNASVQQLGFCYSTNPHPDTTNNKKSVYQNVATFSSTINTFSESTTYYLRGFAILNSSLIYGEEISFTTPLKSVQNNATGYVYGNDYHEYQTITIGNQTWMADDHIGKEFRNGYYARECYANNWVNSNSEPIVGYLFDEFYSNWVVYNHKAIEQTTGEYVLAPQGWHLPSLTEWELLINKYGGYNSAASMLMANATWNSPYCTIYNYSGMSLKGFGFRDENGIDSNQGIQGVYWTSTPSTKGFYAISIAKNCSITKLDLPSNTGCSVRFIKD